MLQLPLQMLMLKIKTCLHLEKAPADKRFIFHKGRFQFWMSDKYTRECILLVYGISVFFIHSRIVICFHLLSTIFVLIEAK